MRICILFFLNIFIRNHLSIKVVLFIYFPMKRNMFFLLIMREHIFSFSLAWISRVTTRVIQIQRKMSLIRCQNDRKRSGRSGIPTAGSSMFDGLLIFLCGLIPWVPKEIRVRSTRSLSSRSFFFVSDTNRRITWLQRDFNVISNRWTSYPSPNALTTRISLVFSQMIAFVAF